VEASQGARYVKGTVPHPSAPVVASLILLTAACWMLHLYWHRRAGLVPLFSALYLVFPAISLCLMGGGLPSFGPFAEWGCVAVMGLLTVAMIRVTQKTDGSVLRGLVAAEAERSKVVREDRDREEERQRLILRVKAYALAEVASVHLPQSSAPSLPSVMPAPV